MRRQCEREWGCRNLEVTVSRLSQTEAFRRFAAHLSTNLAAVPRSLQHGDPGLPQGERHPQRRTTPPRNSAETKHRSGMRTKRPPRTRVGFDASARSFARGPSRSRCSPASASATSSSTASAAASTTRSPTRSSASISASSRPAYQVLSATLHLPLPQFDSTSNDLKQAQRIVRDLHWNPQRHLVSPSLDDSRVLRLVADQITCASNEPPQSDREARREWFERLRELNEKLRPHVWKQVPPAKAALIRAEAESRANAILKRRDFSWVLYPENILRPFLQRFLQFFNEPAGDVFSPRQTHFRRYTPPFGVDARKGLGRYARHGFQAMYLGEAEAGRVAAGTRMGTGTLANSDSNRGGAGVKRDIRSNCLR